MRNNKFREKYGPWAIVAGASEGLGAAFAEESAKRGLNIVLVARSKDKLISLQHALADRYKTECRILIQDLADQAAATLLDRQTSDIDIGLMVYNAALSLIGPYLSFSEPQHRATVVTNCQTPALCAYLFGKRFKARGRGGMILMSSLAGFQGSPSIAHYAATKAYSMVLAQGLSREYAADNIDVLACCAGSTGTPGYYKASKVSKKQAFVMRPQTVARMALDNIHRRGIFVPGFFNTLGAIALQRLLPRRVAVGIIAQSTREMAFVPSDNQGPR